MTESASVETQESEPWFRHGWVWFVFLVPLSAVAFGVVMIVSANYQRDDLVVDDYYKAGKGINRRLEQDQRATDTGAGMQLVAINPEGAVFRVTNGSEEMVLTLFHVSDSQRDLEVNLTDNGAGVYTSDSPALVERLTQPGIWYLEVRDLPGGWRLRQRIQTPLGQFAMGHTADLIHPAVKERSGE